MTTLKFFPEIQAMIIKFYSATNPIKLPKKPTEFEMIHYIKSNIVQETKFLSLLEPDVFLQTIYDCLSFKGAASIGNLTNFFDELINPTLKDPYKGSTARVTITAKLKLLAFLGIVTKQILPYTKPEKVTIWCANFASPNEINVALADYKGYKPGYLDELAMKKRDYTITHDSNKKATTTKAIPVSSFCIIEGCNYQANGKDYCNQHLGAALA